MGFFSWLFKKKSLYKPKLGLALGSGGAKGFAELGALRAFEENNIEFDIIAGTSIGSIIGAFYADGYSCTDILEFIRRVDFGEIKNLFMIRMDTSGLANVLDRTIGGKNIEELKKPFKTVATVVETGEEYVFDKGNVAIALCASSSYPPFFKPVVINDVRYIDGAFSNSIPADLVKDMGAEYIVGIDLSDHKQKNKGGILSKIIPTYQGKVEEPWKKGYENSNVMLHPDLSRFTPVSFKEADTMFEIGYQCAIDSMPKIIDDIKNYKRKKIK